MRQPAQKRVCVLYFLTSITLSCTKPCVCMCARACVCVYVYMCMFVCVCVSLLCRYFLWFVMLFYLYFIVQSSEQSYGGF